MIPFGMIGHHMVGRVPIKSSVHQSLLVCHSHYDYEVRLVLESTPIFKDIHSMKLVRELADAFSNDKPLQSWDVFKDEGVVFHAVYEDNSAYLFVSDKEHDYQFGFVRDTKFLDCYNLANLICHILNGNEIDRFLISSDGEVEDCGGL